MKGSANSQTGFTAVELLITLFIAAAFLLAGYQLSTQVLRDSTDADKVARVSLVTYEKLRKEVAKVPAKPDNGVGCTTLSIPPDPDAIIADEQVSVDDVGTVTLSAIVSCPLGAATSADLFLIRVTASYKDGQATKTLSHASYAN